MHLPWGDGTTEPDTQMSRVVDISLRDIFQGVQEILVSY